MKVVIDTGVLVRAAIKAQTVPSVAVYQAAQRGLLIKSSVTEAELMEVIDRPYLARLIAPATRERLMALMGAAELVTIIEQFAACRDPKDDKFLELAVNGQADIIITGDADLLVLNPFRDIPIVTPAAFTRARVR
jgi:uncharacterized protein